MVFPQKSINPRWILAPRQEASKAAAAARAAQRSSAAERAEAPRLNSQDTGDDEQFAMGKP